MNAEGWKTIAQVSEVMNLSRARVNQMANDGAFECVKRKICDEVVTREINFVRPKV